MKLKSVMNTKQITLIVVFSAIYASMRVIPTFPVIGLEGGYFSVADILAPIFGVMLGPYIGGASVIAGTIIGMFGKAPIFLGLDFLPALSNVIALGFLVRKKWLPVVILNAGLLVVFILNPLTLNFVTINNTALSVPFAWLHIVAFMLLLSPLGIKAGKWLRNTNTKTKTVIAFTTLVFIGTMIQHLMGNILYENIFVHVTQFMTPEALTLRWTAVFFLYPWERLVLIISATIIGLPLLYVLKKTLLIKETNAILLEEENKK